MALRRPSISSPEWLFQDFLYQDTPDGQERYVQVKWDGEVYERKSSTYDYSNPPFADSEQRGGHIVAQLDYEVNSLTRLVTIYNWSVNWRDEWPLRLAINYLTQCLYSEFQGYTIRVAGDQVYSSTGNAIDIAVTSPYAFWVSEGFHPFTNSPGDYLVRVPSRQGAGPVLPTSYSLSVGPNPAVPGSVLRATLLTEGIPEGTPLYWKVSGPGVNGRFFASGMTTGKVKVGQ